MVVDGYAVSAWVLVDPMQPVLNWEGNLVRIQGVHAAQFDSQGEVSRMELFCAGVDRVERVGPMVDAKEFAAPIVRVTDSIELSGPGPVHMEGVVVSDEEGGWMLRDSTGQIRIETGQAWDPPPGSRVEVVGYPHGEGVSPRLVRAWVKEANQIAGESEGEDPVDQRWLHRITASVMELGPEEASRGDPVRLTGVVTWSSPRSIFYFLQDSTGGISVYRSSAAELPPLPGRHVTVVGRTDQEEFSPMVRSQLVMDLGFIARPPEKFVPLEHALTGVEEAQWVRMSGYVHRVRRDGPWARLEMTSTAARLWRGCPVTRRLRIWWVAW